MSQAMRKLTGVASKSRTTLLFINQLRQKIGVVFGNPEVTTGGNALKFYSSVRIEVRRIGPIKDGERVVGNRTRVKVVKNKVAPPFTEVELDILYGRGIWATGDLLDRGLDMGVLEKSGSWLAWGTRQLGQGRDKAATVLEADPKLSESLRLAVLEASRSRTAAAAVPLRAVAANDAPETEEAREAA
jgi:recombination protein RecA